MLERVHTRFNDAEEPSLAARPRSCPAERRTNSTARPVDGTKHLNLEPGTHSGESNPRPSKKQKRDNGLDANVQNAQGTPKGYSKNIAPTHASNRAYSIGNNSISQVKGWHGPKTNSGRSIGENPSKHEAEQVLKFRQSLPIWSKRPDIRHALRRGDCLLLIGETGSGKSTQVPQILYSEPWCKRQAVKLKDGVSGTKDIRVGGMIAVTQPRRIATQTLAKRVDHEMVLSSYHTIHNPVRVGYSVRFASNIPSGTKVKFMTEGTLLQEMIKDPYLKQYSAIVVDEIHERSVDVDLIAGFLRNILHGDKNGRGGIPLKIVVMSATLDLGGLDAFFAKPETRPDYQPGRNHGAVLAPHLQGDEEVKRAASTPYHPETRNRLDIISDKHKSDRRLSKMPLKLGPGSNESQKQAGSAVNRKHRRTGSAESSSSWSGISSAGDEAIQPQSLPVAADTTHEVALNVVSRDFNAHSDGIDTGVVIEYVEGRQYKVELIHEKEPQHDYLDAMLRKILHVHTNEPLPGDILAFLTGQEDISTLQSQLEHHGAQLAKGLPRIKVMPLYGSLPAQHQQEAFEKVKEKNTRKIVLATNIAETSVTVLGVRYVIDSGKAKVKQYRASLGMESLLVKPISRVSAIQRKGRAGREGPGKCWRLYTEDDYCRMEQDEPPEILRTDVVEAVLKMKARGVQDVFAFPLMDAPDVSAMRRALLQLIMLGALDESGTLTDAGRRISAFPLPAVYGKVLIEAATPETDCLLEAIDIVSYITAESDIFLQPKTEEERDDFDEYRKELQRREGDILTYLTTVQRYAAETSDLKDWCRKRHISISALKNAMAIRKQLQRICLSQELLKEAPPPDPQTFEPASPERAEVLIKVFLKAFATKTATLGQRGNYISTQGRHTIAIHPSSVLYGKKMEAIMFLDHVYTTKSYAKIVSAVQSNWIAEAMFA